MIDNPLNAILGRSRERLIAEYRPNRAERRWARRHSLRHAQYRHFTRHWRGTWGGIITRSETDKFMKNYKPRKG